MVLPLLAIGSGVAGALSSYMGGQAAAKAAKQAAAQQRAMYEQSRKDLQPFRDQGAQSMGYWANAQGFNGEPAQNAAWDMLYRDNPAHNRAVQYGTEALQNSAFAKGMGNSGNLANQIADNANRMQYDRGQNALAQWFQGAQLGQNAAAQTGQFGQQAANSAGNYMMQGAQGQAASYMGMGSAFGNALQQYGNFTGYGKGGVNVKSFG